MTYSTSKVLVSIVSLVRVCVCVDGVWGLEGVGYFSFICFIIYYAQ